MYSKIMSLGLLLSIETTSFAEIINDNIDNTRDKIGYILKGEPKNFGFKLYNPGGRINEDILETTISVRDTLGGYLPEGISTEIDGNGKVHLYYNYKF